MRRTAAGTDRARTVQVIVVVIGAAGTVETARLAAAAAMGRMVRTTPRLLCRDHHGTERRARNDTGKNEKRVGRRRRSESGNESAKIGRLMIETPADADGINIMNSARSDAEEEKAQQQQRQPEQDRNNNNNTVAVWCP